MKNYEKRNNMMTHVPSTARDASYGYDVHHKKRSRMKQEYSATPAARSLRPGHPPATRRSARRFVPGAGATDILEPLSAERKGVRAGTYDPEDRYQEQNALKKRPAPHAPAPGSGFGG